MAAGGGATPGPSPREQPDANAARQLTARFRVDRDEIFKLFCLNNKVKKLLSISIILLLTTKTRILENFSVSLLRENVALARFPLHANMLT